eukprot:COSAG01_NODE_11068_length_2015_cov_1.523486_4_plen_102_part_01
MCAGNTKSLHEPDIRCSAPAHRRAHAAQIHGRSATQCCLTEGMCIGNSDATTDVACVAPAVLKPAASLIAASAGCCVTTGMCIGNSDPTTDVSRPFPSWNRS